MEIQQTTYATAILLVQRATRVLKNGIVRRLATARLKRLGILAHNGGFTRHNLTSHVLKLGDARKVLARGVIHGADRLELILIQGDKLHVKCAIRQRTQIKIKQLVQGARINHFPTKRTITHQDGILGNRHKIMCIDV